MIERYKSNLGGTPTEIEVDLAFAPDPDTSWMLWAFTPLQHLKDERDDLLLIIKEICVRLELKNGIHYAGSKISDDWIEIYFYAASSKGAEGLIRDSLSKHGYEKIEFGVHRDSKQLFYHQTLLPDTYELQAIESKKIVDELEAEGDDLSRARRVEHYLGFATSSIASRVAKDLIDLGESRVELREDPHHSHVLVLDSRHTLDGNELRTITKRLIESALKEHGKYLGWSTTYAK